MRRAVIHFHEPYPGTHGVEEVFSAGVVEVERASNRRKADEMALVLVSAGIDVHLVPTAQAISVLVRSDDARRACHELQAHERENGARRSAVLVEPAEASRIEAGLTYCALLVFFFLLQHGNAFSLDWTSAGAAQAGAILDGELWRTVTALTLHSDIGHLMGNLVLGFICGLLVMEVLGAGVGWLAILGAGAFGNVLNSAVQGPEHAAIGASTAVFGAVGVLSGHAQGAPPGTQRAGLGRWAPLAAGVMLLAFLGFGGGRTDIGGHISGFAVGAVIGLAMARMPGDWVQRKRVQHLCGGAALAILALAWWAAV